MLMINMGCEKEKNAPSSAYTWSATIDGVNYDYSTTVTPNSGASPDQGTCYKTTVQGSNLLALTDTGGYPGISFTSTVPLTVGTYTFNSNSGAQNAVSLVRSFNTTFPDAFSTAVPNTQVILNITSVGNAGGIIEGNFSGNIGKFSSSTVSIINISGNFKAYVQN
jgi:hypothetical protein